MSGLLTAIDASPVASDSAVTIQLDDPPGPAAYHRLHLTCLIKDHEGSPKRRELVAAITDPSNELGEFGVYPYSCILSAGTGGVEMAITREQGFPHDFELDADVTLDDLTIDGGNLVYALSDPPTITIVDPGDPIDPTDHIDVTISGPVAADDLQIIFGIGGDEIGELLDMLAVEFAYFGGTPLPPYTVDDLGGGTYRVTRDGGWPSDILVLAVAGSAFVETQVLGVTVFPHETIDPGAAPTTSVTPTPGTQIAPSTPLVVDVTDDSGAFRRVLLMVAYSTGDLAGITELVHDGDAFVGYYSVGCTRDPIAGGFRFTILRDGGWPASPTLRVFAFDRGGNEV